MRISIDCRYARDRPSGIGAYVQALVDRVPAMAPAFCKKTLQFFSLSGFQHSLEARGLSNAARWLCKMSLAVF